MVCNYLWVNRSKKNSMKNLSCMIKYYMSYINVYGILNLLFFLIEKTIHQNRLHVVKTIYINFRLLPFTQAIKLPILIYGKTKIFSLRGRCIIHAPIKFGMIQFGARNKVISISCDKTYIRIDGNVHMVRLYCKRAVNLI